MIKNTYGQYRWAPLLFEPIGFHRRDGLWKIPLPADFERWYSQCASEKTVKALHKAGINLVTTHFFKGFGLYRPEEDVETARKIISLCHQYGIKVLAYVQARTLYLETFLTEVPSAKDWLQRDYFGNYVTFSGEPRSYHRPAPCFNSDQFMSYLKSVIKTALLDEGFDGIHLDNFSINEKGCYCSRCKDRFRDFLKNEYGKALATELGIPSVHFVEPPPPIYRPNDPIWRAWIRFKCLVIENRLKELRDAVKSCGPEKIFAAHLKYPWALAGDYVLKHAVSPDVHQGVLDLNIVENTEFPRLDQKGRVVTNAVAFKLARAARSIAIPLIWLPKEDRPPCRDAGISFIPDEKEAALSLAEPFAFGGHAAGGIWLTLPYKGDVAFSSPELWPVVKEYLDFIRDNGALYEKARPVAEVGLLHSTRALTFDFERTASVVAITEYLFLIKHIPFQVILDAQLNHSIDQFSVLVLPNASILDESEAAVIRDYVAKGGRLIVIGDVGLYDKNMRRRNDYGLSDIIGVKWEQNSVKQRISAYGKGSTLYISSDRFPTLRYGKDDLGPLPLIDLEDYSDVMTIVREFIKDKLQFCIDAPDEVLVDVSQDGDHYIIHVLNFSRTRSVATFKLRNRQIARSRFLTPDKAGHCDLISKHEAVVEVETYGVVIIETRSPCNDPKREVESD